MLRPLLPPCRPRRTVDPVGHRHPTTGTGPPARGALLGDPPCSGRAPQAPRRMTRQTPDRRCRLALRSPVTADAGRSPGTYCARLDPARSRLTTLPASRSASPLPRRLHRRSARSCRRCAASAHPGGARAAPFRCCRALCLRLPGTLCHSDSEGARPFARQGASWWGRIAARGTRRDAHRQPGWCATHVGENVAVHERDRLRLLRHRNVEQLEARGLLAGLLALIRDRHDVAHDLE